MLGLICNFGLIIVGGVLGLLLKKLINKKITDLVMSAMGLVVMYIGIDGVLDGDNALIAVISMAIGALIGAVLDLDDKINRLSKYVETKLVKKQGGFAEGFSTATLVFMIGAMAIVGSIQAGLGDSTTLITKGMIDCVTAVIFASTLGWGVIVSAIPVTIYQAVFVLISGAVTMSNHLVSNMTCVGSLLIIAIGLNMLGVTKIKVMNLLPAMFVPILLCLFM